jgi:cytochrome c-type biogenesis protein CcmE
VDRKRLKFVLLGGGIILSMALLIWAGVGRPGGFVYYLTVTEYVDQQRGETDGFRVNGRVVEGSILRAASGEDVEFVMSDGTTALPVRYHGVIPDTFVDDAEVVVEGALEHDGVFVAHTMLAKCPSKYEAEEQEAQTATALPRSD